MSDQTTGRITRVDLTQDTELTTASVEWIREAEKATEPLLSDGTLMQRAAAGLADVIVEEARECGARDVVVLVGPGNNGGDALYAARNLARDAGVRATVVLAAGKAHTEGLEAVRAAGLDVVQHGDDAGSLDVFATADLVVDGILGIGAQAREGAPWDDLVAAIPSSARVVAVDCPTPGMRADVTVTFGQLKTSLLLDPSACGEVRVVDIGLAELPPEQVDAVRLGVQRLAAAWPVPGARDHKYTRGVVGMATGSDAFVGAAVLGCVAAVTAGPGMVRYVGPQRAGDAVSAAAPEATHGRGRVQAWVVGSGIDGVHEREKSSDRYESAMEVLTEDVPVVLDAGALSWLDAVERPEGAVTVLTPHAGELASVCALLGIRDGRGDGGREVTREVVEADPVRWARRVADETGYVVLLKGGATVVAAPGERDADGTVRPKPVLVENRAPNWLATAGTGDVLAGLLGVALAAGIEAQTACAVATHLHGRAACLANPGGPVRALDVAHHVGRAIAELLEQTSSR